MGQDGGHGGVQALMGIQVVVVAGSHAEVVEKLGSVAPFAEIFPLPEGNFGISVPFKVVDDIGEQVVTSTRPPKGRNT